MFVCTGIYVLMELDKNFPAPAHLDSDFTVPLCVMMIFVIILLHFPNYTWRLKAEQYTHD